MAGFGRLFRWFVLRRMRQQPLRALLTAAGVALGVAVVIGIRLANVSSVDSFAASVEALAGAASLEISGPGGVREDRIAGLGWLREFGTVAPVIEADGTIQVDGRAETIKVLGIDILRDRALREFPLRTADGEGASGLDVFRILTAPDAIVLPSAVGDRLGLAPGDAVVLAAGGVRRRLQVSALLAPARNPALAGTAPAVMDIATAQWAFDRLGWIDRLELRLQDDADAERAEGAIARRLPEGLTVSRPSRRGLEVERMLRAFHFNLSALSYVALLVGLFLVYNTIVTSAIARREEVGMLRALGTPRTTLLGLFLGEAAVLAGLGTIAGLACGALLAHGAVRLTAATVRALYVNVPLTVPLPSLTEAAIAAALGLGLSVLATVAPAREGSSIPPLAALGGAAHDPGERHRTLRATIAGIALLAAALGLSRLDAVGGLPIFGFAAAVATVLGTAFLAPLALRASAAAARRPLRAAFGAAGMLAHAALSASTRRLAASAAALAASVAMLVAIAVMVGSFRETVVYWLSQTLRADLYVAAGGRSAASSPATIPAGVERIIAAHPAVSSIDAYRGMSVSFEGRPVVLAAADFAVIRDRRTLLFKEPGDPAAALASASEDEVLVSEPFAVRHRLRAGDTIRLDTPEGPRALRVAAIYYDYSTDRGVVLQDWSSFRNLFGDLRPTNLAIFLAPDAAPVRVHEELTRTLGGTYRVFMFTSGALREQALRTFDRTFAVTYALEAIAIAVAMLGIAATLITLIVERSRELTVLRLLGTSRAQMRSMVLLEAALLAVVSLALGLPAGFALAVLLVGVINLQSFGWTIQYDVPVMFLVQACAALVLAAIGAGLYPARIAAAATPDLREAE